MPEVTVRPMTEDEFEEWRHALARAYADEQVAAGNWQPDDALELALDGNAALLPQGLATPGMLLLKGVLEDGTPIGRLWIGLRHPRGLPGCAFVYDLEVDEEHRGAGSGRALLAAGEAVARSHGAGALELNVFGGNTRAIGLYSSAGYRVVSQQMRKELTPSPPRPLLPAPAAPRLEP
jgi:ribosomal protein S18 acetylase RimI-like enzyme